MDDDDFEYESMEIPMKDQVKPYPTIFNSIKSLTLSSLPVPEVKPESSLSDPKIAEIQSKIDKLQKSMMSKKPLVFPSGHPGNSLYEREISRFSSHSTISKDAILYNLLGIIAMMCGFKIHWTRRNLFYACRLFPKQSNLDFLLDYVSVQLNEFDMWSATEFVVPTNGVVVGNLSFTRNGGKIVDCAKKNICHTRIRGKTVPSDIDGVGDVKSNALFILLVEKVSTYVRLVEDKFYEKFPCIIVMANGLPTAKTRLFLIKVKKELSFNLPIFALVDASPSGFNVLASYKNDKLELASPEDMDWLGYIKWLGLRPTDFSKYEIPREFLLKMSKDEIEMAKELLKTDFVKSNLFWEEELKLMVKNKNNVEIEVFS